MSIHSRYLYLLIALVLISTLGGLYYVYNEKRQMTEQQALASFDRGVALFQEKKYAESLEIFQSIPDGVLHDWQLPYYKATAHVMLREFESSIPELEKALALNPEETRILFELGVVYYKLGNLALSKGYFGTVVKIDPSNEEARGLMDIMANLERQQTRSAAKEPSDADQTGSEQEENNENDQSGVKEH